jgi:hypothetical protein
LIPKSGSPQFLIQVRQQVTFTLVNLGPGIYEARTVSLGRTVSDHARIVIAGSYYIKSEEMKEHE